MSTDHMNVDAGPETSLRDVVTTRGGNDPAWLATARQDALSAYEASSLPDRVQHLWRYTDPQRFLPGERTPTTPDSHFGDLPADCQDATYEHVAGYALARDGRVLRSALDPLIADKKVVLTDLCTAAREHEDLVRPRLFSLLDAGGDKFEQLSAATFAGGTFFHVPRNVTIDRPFVVAHRVGGDGLIASRSLLVAGEGSEATIVFDLTSVGDDDAPLRHEGLEIHVEPGARLHVAFVQACGKRVTHAPVIRCRVERDAALETVSVALGGALVKSLQTTELVGKGSDVRVLGIVFANGRQHIDHHTLQDHVIGRNTSNLDYRTVVADRARSSYTGNLRIGLDGVGADAHQSNHNMLLSKKARADTIPELEILTNDVTCSHAAACGPIDEEMITFCQSRGISPRDARTLIVTGFLEPIVERVPGQQLRERVRSAVADRLDRVV